MKKPFKYKKISTLILIYTLAIFLSPLLSLVVDGLYRSLGYISPIILGLFYSFTFTAGAATVMLYNFSYHGLSFVALVAVGSMLADFVIFKIFKIELIDEINLLLRERPVKKFFSIFKFLNNNKLKEIIGFTIVGSPLPDEIGILLLAKSKLKSGIMFFILSYIANFVGILFIMSLK